MTATLCANFLRAYYEFEPKSRAERRLYRYINALPKWLDPFEKTIMALTYGPLTRGARRAVAKARSTRGCGNV